MNDNETNIFEEIQSKTNASDPVACAKFFNIVVRTFIECILGWDQNSHSYREGYFGKTVAHFGVVEEQQRKQLHLHLLVWVENYGSYESFHEKMKEELFKSNFITYIKKVIIQCVAPTQIATEYLPSKFLCPPLDNDSYEQVVEDQLGWVQSKCQLHKCSIFYCMKNGRRCKFKFPKDHYPETEYNQRQKKIFFKRDNAYLNSCCPAISVICRCNNDIVFLPGTGNPKAARCVAYYASNYTSKVNSTRLQLMEYMKRKIMDLQKYQPEMLENPKGLAQSLLSKTLNNLAAANEVGSVEVASTLLGYSDHYTSRKFCSINWKGWDLWLCKELCDTYSNHSYTRFLDRSNVYHKVLCASLTGETLQDRFTLISFIDEYLDREESLSSLSIWEMASIYNFGTEKEGREFYPLKYPDRYLPLSLGHTEYLVGRFPCLPWFNSKSSTHGVGSEAFYRIMMTLFRSFRTAQELKPQSTFKNAYVAWKLTLDLSRPPYTYMVNIENEGQTMIDADTPEMRQHAENIIGSQNDSATRERISWNPVSYFTPVTDTASQRIASNTLQNVISLQNQLNERFKDRLTIPTSSHFTPIVARDFDDVLQNVSRFLRSKRTSKTCQTQWNALKIIALHVCKMYCGIPVDPIRMLIHGEGGTGKSFVINTIRSLFELLHISQRIVVGAPTGRAAIAVSGDTFDG
ncbi:hypothetical protein HDV02_005938, partial [Globomyces sp. JEL0801]